MPTLIYDIMRVMFALTGPAAFICLVNAGISLVLFCPMPGRSPLIRDLPENTLLDRLGRGEVPTWLREAARDPSSGHVLYRVKS